MTDGPIRLEHLPADLHGLLPVERAALAGALTESAVHRRIEDIPAPKDPYLPAERAHLAKWIEAQVTGLGPHVAVLDSIRSIALPGTCCVLSHAKPGLLMGTMEPIWSCLQSIRLARELSALWGTQVIPVLWNDCDGHDSRSLEQAQVLNHNNELQCVRLEAVARGAVPLSSVTLDSKRHGLGALRAALDQLFGDFPEIDQALDLFVPREGESLPRSFTRSLYELFGKHGLVVVESAGLREEISGAMAKVVSAAFLDLLRSTTRDLAAYGELDLENEGLLQHLEDHGLRTLTAGGDGYRYTDEPGSRTRSELAAEIVQEPGAWTPGQLMGPLIRGQVLPIAATLGGPDDLLRHLLVAPLHRELDRSTPAFVGSLTGTLIGEAARDSLQQLDLDLVEVLRKGATPAASSSETGTIEVLAELAGVSDRARAELRSLKPRLMAIDGRLGTPTKQCSRQLEALIHKLSQKVARVQANRDGRRDRHRRGLENGLRPLEGPQARVLGPFTWVAKYGSGWIDELLEELEPMTSEHLGVHLG